jgi:Mg2+ and Co2+ transporter CorA
VVLDNPLSLVWDYSAGPCGAFASHLELYRRKWEILYQPYANTSAVYGNAQSREYVRREAIELATHLQYMQRSLQSLLQIIPESKEKKPRSDMHSSGLDAVIQDLEQLSADLERLKRSYDAFIEQMVSKISLAEARTSMTEARDLQLLSYLGFVFAPLSLASSFFSINIRPLGGSAPV